MITFETIAIMIFLTVLLWLSILVIPFAVYAFLIFIEVAILNKAVVIGVASICLMMSVYHNCKILGDFYLE